MNRLVTIIAVFIVFLSLGLSSADAQTAAQSVAPTRVRETTVGDNTPTIFDVRKSLPMEPTDPTYHDFYINAGVEAGFKKGQYLPVQRAIPVHDPVKNIQQALLTVPVGKVLVIHVEQNMTVARLVTELGDEERPTLEYESIMIGDRVDMKGITTEAPKNIKKKKTAAAQPSAPTTHEPTVMVAAPVEAAPVPAPAAQAAAPAPLVVPAVTPESGKPVKTESAAQPSTPPRVTQAVPPPTA